MARCWVPYYSLEISPGNQTPCCKIWQNDPHYTLDFAATPPGSAEYQQWIDQHFAGDGELPSFCRRACAVTDEEYSYRRTQQRLFQLQGFDQPQEFSARKLVLGMDNICRSSCVMCQPAFSHSIGQLLGQPMTQRWPLQQLVGIMPSLEHLQLYGGEPLFSPGLPELLQLLDQHAPRLKSIGICTGMNGVKDSHCRELARFRDRRGLRLGVIISQEAELELNSWIRGVSPSEWQESLAVIDRHGVGIWGLQTTIGVANAWQIPQWLAWIRARPQGFFSIDQPQFLSSVIHGPRLHHPSWLPDSVKQRALAAIDQDTSTEPWAREILTTARSALARVNRDIVPWSKVNEEVSKLALLRGQTQTISDIISQALDIEL